MPIFAYNNKCLLRGDGIGDLCNGSTPDSDSVCGGSNPSSPARKNPVTVVTGFFLRLWGAGRRKFVGVDALIDPCREAAWQRRTANGRPYGCGAPPASV